MKRHASFIISCKRYSSTLASRRVWVVTDGSIEHTLPALALGKKLSGANQDLKLKTIVASQKLQLFPNIIQKYIVDYRSSKHQGNQLPWYLSSPDHSGITDEPYPDYVVASGQDAVPACLHITNIYKKSFSVFVGYPHIPFINFDQVVLPKYEANTKMAALGPLAKQKNGIITPAPLLSMDAIKGKSIVPSSFQNGYSAVIVGGHSAYCRWYSEDAVTLGDNVKRIVQKLQDKVVIVYTDRTSKLVKEAIDKRLDSLSNVIIWDSTKEEKTIDKIEKYEDIIANCQRAILTADLDYPIAHAITKNKPVYTTFGGYCRSYLLQFNRWMLDNHLIRKLRLDKSKYRASDVQDDYSYLGNHAPWGDANKVFQVESTMASVVDEIETVRQETITGKRRKTS
ncbi:hypothetical protein RMCBS344292_08008 [Rhizopus microsporus]|nr:hypothetical protein RMCBS344292_08008 [Rhizopus microsporus]